MAPCRFHLTGAGGGRTIGGMELLAAAGRAVEDAEVDHFTGAATMQRFLGSGPDAAGRVYRVAFEPGAGTNWHTHSDVQILYVVEGRCAIQSWGGAVQVAKAGDVVRFDPGEKHWHGATADGPMTHIAINLGESTEWLEPVASTA